MTREITAIEIAELIGKTKRAVLKRSINENWQYTESVIGRGGATKIFEIQNLPPDVQTAIAETGAGIPAEVIAEMVPEAQLAAAARVSSGDNLPVPAFCEVVVPEAGAGKNGGPYNKGTDDEFAISADVLRDDRVGKMARIVQEAMHPLPGYSKSAWHRHVAIKHEIHPTTIYRNIRKYERAGIAGFKRIKRTRGESIAWDPEALEYWYGLCLKRNHRKLSKKALYASLSAEAEKRDGGSGRTGRRASTGLSA